MCLLGTVKIEPANLDKYLELLNQFVTLLKID